MFFFVFGGFALHFGRYVHKSMLVTCYVHGQQFPQQTCEQHHLTPRSSGGLDDLDNLVWLCANCHTLAHRCAQMHLAKKSGLAKDTAEQAYPYPSVRSRFTRVVQEIINAKGFAEDFQLGKDKALCQVQLSHDVYAKLKTLSYEKKESGRRVGVSRYIEALILDHLRKKGLL